MKATGIVRRLDELGRVVIPKEIRKTLRLKEGDPMEIYTERDHLLLRKYSPLAAIDEYAQGVADSIADVSGFTVAILDADKFIAVSGTDKKGLVGADISIELAEVFNNRKSFVANLSEGATILPLTAGAENDATSMLFIPVMTKVLCLGAVVMLGYGKDSKIDSAEIKMVQVAVSMLAKHFE